MAYISLDRVYHSPKISLIIILNVFTFVDSEGKKQSTAIKIATATVNADSANIRGLENTDSEKRVVKHLESAIKEKVRRIFGKIQYLATFFIGFDLFSFDILFRIISFHNLVLILVGVK